MDTKALNVECLEVTCEVRIKGSEARALMSIARRLKKSPSDTLLDLVHEALGGNQSKKRKAVIGVPAWVPKAFHPAYVTIARHDGEESAASHARDFKRVGAK